MGVKRQRRKLLQPFLTGDVAVDSHNYCAWANSKNAWRPPEEIEANRKFWALPAEERKKLFPRGSENYTDQWMFERQNKGKHFDGDPFYFAEWLNRFRELRGIPKMSWGDWKTVPPWQKAKIKAYEKLRDELGLDQKAYPCIFAH